MSIAEILPSVISLPHADKFRLVQLLLEQLAKEDGIALQSPPDPQPFNPRQFFGVAHSSRQEVDAYLADMREGWQPLW
ncbi:hypothetical protein [Candidatus Thiothrix anitrata]|uniref:Uncharacterized protein n=3 Tax=Thiothrix TaxID=1030 RepID=A0ABX7X3G5_9GAMM|nr:hypothetical protein [Candidatus Thiothrix anitrata]QTR50420.1 hypothetical protein J8380_02220 [Candidatus Thiothrix anitrata]